MSVVNIHTQSPPTTLHRLTCVYFWRLCVVTAGGGCVALLILYYYNSGVGAGVGGVCQMKMLVHFTNNGFGSEVLLINGSLNYHTFNRNLTSNRQYSQFCTYCVSEWKMVLVLTCLLRKMARLKSQPISYENRYFYKLLNELFFS
jgi:hypothetical protein